MADSGTYSVAVLYVSVEKISAEHVMLEGLVSSIVTDVNPVQP